MPARDQRMQRIAVGFAALALAVAAVAVVVVIARRHERAAPIESQRVAAGDLVQLARPGAAAPAEGGLRVVDEALARALGLDREATVVAIAGCPVADPRELPELVRQLAALAPRRVFVELLRERAPVIVRWELDGGLAEALGASPPDPRGLAPADPLLATIRRIDPVTYAVPRATVEAWIARMPQLLAGVSAIRVASPDGFQLSAIRPGSILARLGLQDGDLVRGLNGVGLDALDQVVPAIARSTGRISIDLWRAGRTIILNYLIQ